jgi:hypothetical protein
VQLVTYFFRYGLDIDFKNVVASESVTDVTKRRKMRKQVKKLFQERYAIGCRFVLT